MHATLYLMRSEMGSQCSFFGRDVKWWWRGALCQSDEEKFTFIDTTVLLWVKDSSLRTTITGTELARAATVLLVKWALIWQVSLLLNFQSNISKFVTSVFTSRVLDLHAGLLVKTSNLPAVCPCRECNKKGGEMYWNEPLWLDTFTPLFISQLTSLKEANEVKEELQVQGKHCLPKVCHVGLEMVCCIMQWRARYIFICLFILSVVHLVCCNLYKGSFKGTIIYFDLNL